MMPDSPLIICRCEQVTAAAIEEALAMGAESVNGIKQLTRAGMGMCQGRVCLHLIRARVGEAGLNGAEPAVRWPVRPVGAGEVAGPAQEPRPDDLMSLLDLDE